MASSDSQIDKQQHGHPKRADLPDVTNINTGVQSVNTERASLMFFYCHHLSEPVSLASLWFFPTGIRNGRKGLGSIYVWATGNGGHYDDYCTCDGYITSIFTVSIGAVNDRGKSPWYAEPCPSTLAVTFSSGKTRGPDKQIITTDLHNQCTKSHTGTSAAAPLAAGGWSSYRKYV